MRIIRALALMLFVFGLVGFIYVAGNAWFHPQTLSMGLTHFAPWPREDTSGIICFFVSAISFFIWNLLRERKS